MERTQIDLIDMRHSPDDEFHYIGHFQDHMTKFNILFPLKDKSAAEVAKLIEERVLAYVGAPHIFHSDNGREFVNKLLHSLLDIWSSGNVTFVNGRPRHSQSQGLVERSNRVVEEMIAAIKRDEGYDGALYFPWAAWLPRIMFNMNTQVHSTIKDMPYKLVFGQVPRSALVPNAAEHIVNEEEINAVISSSREPTSLSQSSTTSTSPGKVWIVQKEKTISWTTSPTTPIQQLPTTPIQQLSTSPIQQLPTATVEQLPATPIQQIPTVSEQPKLPSPSGYIQTPKTSSPVNDILREEWSSREGPVAEKCKAAESPEDKHENIRKKARDETFKSAVSMSNYYNKTKGTKAVNYKEGDAVSFLVPKIDRCSTDMQRIPGVVCKVSGGEKLKFFSIATSVGVIKHKFRGDLSAYTGDVKPNTKKEISIHEAAKEINAANKFTVNRCKCKGKCDTAICCCRRSKIKCSTHCLLERRCTNTSVDSTVPNSAKQSRWLNQKDIKSLESCWLNDNHMLAVNRIFKEDYPNVDGLQDTVLQQNYSWEQPTSQYVQFLHVNGNHWITISNINVSGLSTPQSAVFVYDSMHGKLSDETKMLISKFHQGKKLYIYVMNVQQQTNSSDCGPFAIAFAKSILSGQDPTKLAFHDPREHLLQNLPSNKIPQFPSSRTTCSQPVVQKAVYFPCGVGSDLLDFTPTDKKVKTNLKKLTKVNTDENDFEEDLIALL